jgi:hypothetical protein
MNRAQTKEFIQLLTTDALVGTFIDENGVSDETNTKYPVISGLLRINHSDSVIDDELDLELTKIINRYPDLLIEPPKHWKEFSDCKWY